MELTVEELRLLVGGLHPKYIRNGAEIDCADVIPYLAKIVLDNTWFPYPENIPEERWYEVGAEFDDGGIGTVGAIYKGNNRWIDESGWDVMGEVLAFRNRQIYAPVR